MKVFLEQIDALTQLVMTAPPTEAQQKDLDYLQVLGQLFAQVVYAQLICESSALAMDSGEIRPGSVSQLDHLTEAHIDRMFAVFIQDTAEQAVALHGQASATDDQRSGALGLIRNPVIEKDAEDAFVAEVLSYDGAYEWRP